MKLLTEHEQSIPSEWSAADNQAKVEALCRLIQRLHNHFAFALIEFDLPSLRDSVIGEICKDLSDMNVVPIPLTPPSPDAPRVFNTLDQLENLVKLHSPGKPPDAIIITHFETWFPDLSDDNGRQTSENLARAIQPLNLGRNLLAEGFPYPVLMCLPPKQMAMFLRSAPDLVSWRSGFYQFRSDLDRVRSEILRESEISFAWRVRQRFRRLKQRIIRTETSLKNSQAKLKAQVQRLETLIADAKELSIDKHALAGLYERLGLVYVELDSLSQAREMFAEMQKLVANNKRLARSSRKRLRYVERQKKTELRLDRDSHFIHEVFRGARAPTKTGELHGRENKINSLFARLENARTRFLILHGERECGKSSLVSAGLVPKLPQHRYIPVEVIRWDKPEANIRAALEKASGICFEPDLSISDCIQKVTHQKKKTVLIICDQFELFFNQSSRSARDAFLADVVKLISITSLNCKFLFIISQDHLSKLTEFDNHRLDPLANEVRFYLPPFSESDAISILRLLSHKARMNWADTFVRAVAKDLAKDGRVHPLHLQLVASAIALSGITSELDYSRAGGAQGLRGDYLDLVIDSLVHRSWHKEKLMRVLLAMIDKNKRISLSALEIAQRTNLLRIRLFVESVRVTLDLLIEGNLIRQSNEAVGKEGEASKLNQSGVAHYELVHDELIKQLIQSRSQHQQRKAHKMLRRSLKESQFDSRYALGLREWWFIRKNCPKDEMKQSEVKELFRRSLRYYLTKWMILIIVGLLALTALIQFNSAHLHLRADTHGRLMIHGGHPLLDFLPPIYGSASLDTGFSSGHFKFENQADDTSLVSWGLIKRRDEVLEEDEFLNAIRPPVLRGKVLCQIGQLEKGTSVLTSAMDDPASKEAAIEALAAVALAETSYASKLVERLKKEMSSPNLEVSKKAMAALGWLILADSNLAATILDLIKDQVKNKNDDIRKLITILLSRVAQAEPKLRQKVVSLLIQTARDKTPQVSQASVQALSQLARTDSESAIAVMSQLSPMLKTFNSNTAWQFIEVIALDAQARPAVTKQAFDEIISLIKGAGFYQQANAIESQAGIASQHYLPDEIKNALIALIKSDTTLVDSLLAEMRTNKSPMVRVAAAQALGEIVQEQAALANKVFDSILPALGDPNVHARDEAALALGKIAQSNPGLSEKALDKLLLMWPRRKENRRTLAIALVETSQANNELRSKAYDLLINSWGGSSAEIIPALCRVAQSDPKLASDFLIKLRSIPYSDLENNKKMVVAWAQSLALIAHTDPLLAESSYASLLHLLMSIQWPTRSSISEELDQSQAEAAVLVWSLQQVALANWDIAESIFDLLLGLVMDNRYASLRAILQRDPKGRNAIAEALQQLLMQDQRRWGKAFDLLSNCSETECQEVRDALVGLILSIAEKQENPSQFLIDQLEGSQSPLGNYNADTSAMYRYVIVGALARLLALNVPNVKITEEELRRELQQLRSKEQRTHWRIAMWNISVEVARLREQEKPGYNLLEYGRF